MKKVRLTKNTLRRLINEEIERVEEGGMLVPYQDNPRRGSDSPAVSGRMTHSSGPHPDDALSTDQLFALFNAGFSPQSVANVDKRKDSQTGEYATLTPDMVSALQSAGLL